jgi:hypothetical protein
MSARYEASANQEANDAPFFEDRQTRRHADGPEAHITNPQEASLDGVHSRPKEIGAMPHAEVMSLGSSSKEQMRKARPSSAREVRTQTTADTELMRVLQAGKRLGFDLKFSLEAIDLWVQSSADCDVDSSAEQGVAVTSREHILSMVSTMEASTK